ncbi:MAG: ankyrin repeat domain-containing protein [Planctomycetaceae bacterium]|nr:ankyrin repeat domain-containing protein [Planctomycetaceae bacterium]
MKRIFVKLFSCLLPSFGLTVFGLTVFGLMAFGLATFGQEIKEINPAAKAALVRHVNPKISLDEIKKLVGQGADVNAKDAAGRTFLQNFLRHNRGDVVEIAKYLIEQKIDINKKDNLGHTLLHAAADSFHVNLDVVKLLVENGAEVNAKDHAGRTPLHYAIQGTPKKDVAKYLVGKGADLLAVDNFGRTPSLMLNQNKADDDWVKILTNKENINQADTHGRTILNNAIKNNLNWETIEFLCKEYNADTNQIDRQGKTPLHHAVTKINENNKKNRLETIKILLKNNTTINTKDQQGLTALAIVAENPICNDIITMLVQHGADINCKNQKGTPFLQILLENQTDADLLKKIITENKINTDTEIIKEDSNLLHIAAGQKNGLEKIKLLTQLGFKIDTKNNLKQTPLLIAASTQDKTEILEYLIENGADVNAKDEQNKTPLAHAVEHALESKEDLKVVEYLLKQKIEINAKDNNGMTPLMAVLRKEYVTNTDYTFEKLIKIVQLLINNKADINAKDNTNNTPLHHAAFIHKMIVFKDKNNQRNGMREVRQKNEKECKEYLELIKLLVKNDADINAKNNDGLTPLVLMISFYHVAKLDLKILKYMIEQGADSNAKDSNGMTPFQIIVRQNATLNKAESAEFFKLLTEHGGEIDWSKDKSITPITWALHNGADVKEIKYFIEHGADVNTKDNVHKKTPLTMAMSDLRKYDEKKMRIIECLVQNGADVNEDQYERRLPYQSYPPPLFKIVRFYTSLDLVKLFVEKGADVRFRDEVSGGVLIYAIEGDAKKEIISYLIKQGADIDMKDIHGCQPIHHLSRAHHVEILKLFIDLGADINAKSNRNERPIHCAAQHASIEIIKAMIENGADINVKDNIGRTPLMLSLYARKPDIDIIKLFIKHGNKVKDTDDAGINSLHFAAENRSTNIDIVKFLVTENDIDINAKTLSGNNVLHFAARSPTSQHATEVIKYLVDKGADINAINNQGETPAQIALKKMITNGDIKSEQFREILAVFKLDVSQRLADDRTLLHWVAMEGRRSDIVRVLLDAGIPINAKDKFGSTALHLAVANNDLAAEKIIQCLLDNGADVNATDIYNATPLHDAASANVRPRIFAILLQHNADVNAKDIHGLKPIDLLREELEPEKANLIRNKK